MKKYLILTILLFGIEVYIALYMHDAFVRPFFGDFLAVLFVYCGLRIFPQTTSLPMILLSVGIAYFLEFLQYIHFLAFTGLGRYRILAVLIGSSFSWWDILAYTIGFIFIYLLEFKTIKNEKFRAF